MADEEAAYQDSCQVISNSAKDGVAVQLWAKGSLPAYLLGQDCADVPSTWSLQQLHLLDRYKLPCVVSRYAPDIATFAAARALLLRTCQQPARLGCEGSRKDLS